VRTTVENRNLGENGGGALLIDGRPYTTELGTAATLSNTRWLHLRGVGGYVPLDDAKVSVLREDRTGSWHDADTGGGTTTPYTRRYQKSVIEHCRNPSAATVRLRRAAHGAAGVHCGLRLGLAGSCENRHRSGGSVVGQHFTGQLSSLRARSTT
jgi:hypothetical protein